VTWLNEIAAIPALLIWALVFRGFWPHLRLRGTGPLHFMVQGVSVTSAVVVARLLYWDVLRPLLRAIDLLPPVTDTLHLALANGLFNSITALSGYLILVGLHHTLPADERRFYTPFTAPFYPRGIMFFRKDRE